MKELKNILNELGLSSYKAEAYLTLLKLKTATIQQTAKKSDVPACKLYETLKWLYENGFISLTLEKPLTYTANDPRIILKQEILKRKSKLEEINKQLSKLEIEIPESEKEIIQLTGTREAFVKKMKESLINSKKSVCYIVDNWSEDSELYKISKEKIKKGIEIKALGPINKQNKEKVKWSTDAGIKVKNFSPGSTRFSIFDNDISVIKLRREKSNPVSILIKSEVLTKILQDYFNLLWKNAKQG